MYSCKILLDSISETGKRITTFELTYPRIIHSEFMTHRMFSRNAASSRAIPAKRMREMVEQNCYVPDRFPKNIAGMQPAEWFDLESSQYSSIKEEWLLASKAAIGSHKFLEELGVHKQITNRLLEPFLWYTCIVTATEFDNFFKLRCDENAQYEIRRIANLMYEAYHTFDYVNLNNYNPDADGITNIQSKNNEWQAIRPQKLKVGEWHCPLVYEDDDVTIYKYVRNNVKKLLLEFGLKAATLAEEFAYVSKMALQLKKRISVARCARVSYLTHNGKRDIEKDLELFERLRTSGHWSPFEHVATPYFEDNGPQFIGSYDEETKENRKWHNERYCNLKSGNFYGFKQYRKEFADENCINFRKEN